VTERKPVTFTNYPAALYGVALIASVGRSVATPFGVKASELREYCRD
jgi:hypothetical protein